MYIKGRHARFVDLATKVAETSVYPDYRHGAILVKGGSVISLSPNKSNFTPFGMRFRRHGCGHATHHAELGAILGVDKNKTNGASLYVVRIGRSGELRMSKPCSMCEQVLKYVGVKRVFYSTGPNSIEEMRL